jgi:DNA invertase Pin-like site-specific DNA recombinase
MVFGYLRGSLHDQLLDVQRQALDEAGCAEIYEDHVGGTRAERPGLESDPHPLSLAAGDGTP